ncbi:MAG: elongation factor P [Bacteroidia bacterium]|jgi:elongation factor P|nr:elongation factor P [Bacteroidia bacterium]
MANTGDLSRGSFIKLDNQLYQVLEYQHRTPGNLRAFYQVVLRNVKTGKQVEHRFRAGESIDMPRIEFREYQYLYPDGNLIVLMDPVSYDQISVNDTIFGEQVKYLKDEMIVKVSFEGDEPIGVEIPTFIILEVTYTEPGLKGDTATNTLKPAKLDNGIEVKVPLFTNVGDKVKVDTRTGEYVERVKS